MKHFRVEQIYIVIKFRFKYIKCLSRRLVSSRLVSSRRYLRVYTQIWRKSEIIIIYVDLEHRTSDKIDRALCILRGDGDWNEAYEVCRAGGGEEVKNAEWQYSDAISAYLTSNLFINVRAILARYKFM